mmetsp:Transcript_54816/g.142714  ORF Transcript_54816/g.142714 Transcript_54816/m.142714 type:complete len:217 (-) Transcript_54816:606-1256(-)
MYSVHVSSDSPLHSRSQPRRIAAFTAGFDLSASFARTHMTTELSIARWSPVGADDSGTWNFEGAVTRLSLPSAGSTSPGSASFPRRATALQKSPNWSFVFLNRLVPYSSWTTTSNGARRRSRSRSTSTALRQVSSSRRWSSGEATVPSSASSRSSCKSSSPSLGSSFAKACKGSCGTDLSRWRKAPMVLSSSSTPRRSMSFRRGPMEPKMGTMYRF